MNSAEKTAFKKLKTAFKAYRMPPTLPDFLIVKNKKSAFIEVKATVIKKTVASCLNSTQKEFAKLHDFIVVYKAGSKDWDVIPIGNPKFLSEVKDAFKRVPRKTTKRKSCRSKTFRKRMASSYSRRPA